MCCCRGGDSVRLGDARTVASDGMVSVGEGIWTLLGASFFRGRCKDFVTLAGLGVDACEGRPARLVASYSQLRRLL